jgi:hypothetical protein
MAEAGHSNWPASGFEALMLCPGKKVVEAAFPRTSSSYSAEGTAYHQVLTWALQEGRPAAAYVGRVVEADGYTFEIDEDNAAFVQVTIDYVRDLAGDDGVVLVDQRVNYSRYLDVPESEAWGTADVIILRGDEIIVVDLKFGRGVEVEAGHNVQPDDPKNLGQWVFKPNPQMALYALGALAGYGDFGDFTRVRMAISQPRITSKPSEYDLSVAELEAWARSTARSAVITAVNAASMYGGEIEGQAEWERTFLRPNEKSCKFCKAKATCPSLRAEVVDTIIGGHLGGTQAATPDEFADLTIEPANEIDSTKWLSVCLSKVDLIEDWCKAVRAEVERRMLAGDTVPGFKLVEGKQGNRAWSDEKAAEALLKSMRLKQEELYDFTVKSPTQIAKLGPTFDKDGKIKPPKEGAPAPTIGPRQWPKVQALITRAPPKKHVAPLSDPRPALVVTPVVDDFDPVTTELQLSDLA